MTLASYQSIPYATHRVAGRRAVTTEFMSDAYAALDDVARSCNVARGTLVRLLVEDALRRPAACQKVVGEARGRQ